MSATHCALRRRSTRKTGTTRASAAVLRPTPCVSLPAALLSRLYFIGRRYCFYFDPTPSLEQQQVGQKTSARRFSTGRTDGFWAALAAFAMVVLAATTTLPERVQVALYDAASKFGDKGVGVGKPSSAPTPHSAMAGGHPPAPIGIFAQTTSPIPQSAVPVWTHAASWGAVVAALLYPESVTPIAADLESHRIHLHKGRFPVLAPDLSFNA